VPSMSTAIMRTQGFIHLSLTDVSCATVKSYGY